METQCTGGQLEFHVLGRRSVTGRFVGGRVSSDGGGGLLREVDRRFGGTHRMANCFVNHRNRASVEHSVAELVSQRIYAVALGYEDLNDPVELRRDALLSLLAGKTDVTGKTRVRQHDRGYALASGGWTSMRPTTRYSVTRKGDSFTATTVATAICRCTSSVANNCCVQGCAGRIRMPRRAAWRNSSASWGNCAVAGPTCASTSGLSLDSVAIPS